MVNEDVSFYIKLAKTKQNFRKVKLVSKYTTGIVLFVIILEAMFFFLNNGEWDGMLPINIWPYFLFMGFNAFCYVYTKNKRVQVTKNNYKKIERFIGLYVFSLASFGVIISLADQSGYNHLMIYTLIMLVSCSYFVLNKIQILIPITIAGFVLVAGLYFFQGNTAEFRSQLLYLMALFPVTYFLSRAFYLTFSHTMNIQARLKSEVEMTKKLSEELREANKKLAIQASIDPLTNLYNRRAINEYIEQLEKRTSEQSYLLSAVVLDIDYFKLYNDTYGHTSGDAVLKKVGEVLLRVAKKYKVFIARWGGEEFTVLIDEQSESKVQQICEEIIHEIHSLQLEHRASLVDRVVTVSMGAHTQLATTPGDILACIEYADAALYSVKENGRNNYEHRIIA